MTIAREPFSPQFLFSQRVRSMKSVSLRMLKAEKAGLWQTPETLCWQEPWLLMLLCDGFQEIWSLPRIMLPVPVRSQTEPSIKQLLPSSMSGQCYHLKGQSCSNPVNIHHQWGTRAHLQVSSSDHSERTTLFAVSIFKMSGQ